MATAGGIRAGLAFVEMALNDANFQRGLTAVEGRLRTFASGLTSLGAQLGGLGVAIAAPLAMATSTYAGFEKNMARVDALTRGQAADAAEAAANFRKLTEEAKRLGEQTEYSAGQAAEMMYEFAMRGYKVNDILAATGPALQMATAGNMQLAEAAGIAGDIMGGMKLPAAELGRVTDIMAKAFSTSATDLRQLGEAFKYVGPTASSMGFSVTEVTAALQVLADAGQKGEMAGTTLRGMLETLKDPSKEARDELARLGVVLDNGYGKFRDLASIVGDMEAGLSKLSQVESAAAISRIFTNRQTTGTTILVTPNEAGVNAADRIRTKDKALQDSQGTGAAIQARQLDTLWGAWKLIESAIEGVAITIGETLAPTIREWASAAIQGIGLLHDWVKLNKDWIPVIAKTAAVIVGIGSALFAVGATVGVVGFAVGGLATAFSVVASAVGMAVGVIGAVFSAVWAVGVAAFGAVSAAAGALLTPVGLVVGAVAAVAAGLYYLLGSETFFYGLKVAIGVVAAAIGVVAVAFYAWYKVVEFAVTKAISLLADLWGAIQYGVTSVAAFVAKAFAPIANFVSGVFAQVKGAVKPFLDWIVAGVDRAFAGIGEAVSTAVSETGRRLGALWSDLTDTFTRAWGGIVDAVKAGDLELAGKVAMAGFTVAWRQGQVFLISSWRDSLGFIYGKWVDLWRDIGLAMNNIWYSIERTLFEGLAMLYRSWGWVMDSMRRQMAAMTAGWNVMQEGFKAGVTFDLNFQDRIKKASEEAVVKLQAELKQIRDAREVEIQREITGRADVDTRKMNDDWRTNKKAEVSKKAFGDETARQLEGPSRELADAQKELDKLVQQAADQLKMKELKDVFPYLLPGAVEIMNAAKASGLGPQSGMMDRVNQASGAAMPGSGASGTFDSAVAKFMAGTGNKDLEQQKQTRELEQSKALLQFILKALDDIRREGGAIFQ